MLIHNVEVGIKPYANLVGANLEGANLEGTNLVGANLTNAHMPAAPMLLLASWGAVSDELTAELMLYDAANASDRTKFQRWAEGGLSCPLENDWPRAANFAQSRDIWLALCVGRTDHKPARWLAERLLAECTKTELGGTDDADTKAP
jgi:hypothetical protein